MTMTLPCVRRRATFCSALGLISWLTSVCSVIGANDTESCTEGGAVDYGVDVSYPMHHLSVTSNFAWLDQSIEEYKDTPVQPLGDRQKFYNDLIQGCIDFYGDEGHLCLTNERDRIEMSLRQPQSMKNYTKLGFTKIRAPDNVWKLLKAFWENNKDKQTRESWPSGNTYVNNWNTYSSMVSVEDTSLEGGGYVLKQHIWNAARDTISEWTGHALAECSLYGIRVYKEGAVLAPHVDRLPLVSSAIINVDQDVDEPWPLEVIGHDGRAHNITMEPGDLVLYESHSIIHGRPFPLKGRFMANVFIHFEPLGPIDGDLEYGTSDLPPYVIPGSPEDAHWRSQNPNGHQIMRNADNTAGSTDGHRFAKEGDMVGLKAAVEKNPKVVNMRDVNGWTPLHEAVRKGYLDVVKFLVENGASVNTRTGRGDGDSPLYLAQYTHGNDHAVSKFLESNDAKVFKMEKK